MSTATAVKNHDFHILMSFIQTVSQSSSSRLVDNTLYSKTCYFACFFSSLTLCIVKICRNSNNSFCYFMPKKIFSSFLHFLKDHCRNFLWSIFTVVDLHTGSVIISFNNSIWNTFHFFFHLVKAISHKSFYGRNSFCRVCYSLTFSRITNFTFTIFNECNY